MAATLKLCGYVAMTGLVTATYLAVAVIVFVLLSGVVFRLMGIKAKISRDVGIALAVFWLLIGAYIWRTTHTVKIISDTSNREQVLAFVRNRHVFAEGDHQRGKNQMAVVEAVLQKAVSPAVLSNFLSTPDTSSPAWIPMISTSVCQQLHDGGSWNIVSFSVNGSDSYSST